MNNYSWKEHESVSFKPSDFVLSGSTVKAMAWSTQFKPHSDGQQHSKLIMFFDKMHYPRGLVQYECHIISIGIPIILYFACLSFL